MYSSGRRQRKASTMVEQQINPGEFAKSDTRRNPIEAMVRMMEVNGFELWVDDPDLSVRIWRKASFER
jgi:hypothetical protein